ncbi:MAG: alpha/beta hydrolase [Ruminococcaceae bacterium]|nr:alpha/beta hydrolase [Oscillospiraceae bacterium]
MLLFVLYYKYQPKGRNKMDIKLFYTDNGNENGKAPLVLLHGNGGNASSFFYVVDHFMKSRRVITIDTRGHGRSPKGEGEFTLKRFARDVYEFLGEMKIEKAVIVGYSDGGNIAMILASEHPEVVEALVLNGANMFPSGLRDKDLKSITSAYKKVKKALRRSPNNSGIKDELDLLTLMVKEPNLTAEDLAKITAPSLVLVGSRDVIKPEHSEYIASCLPVSRLKIVEGGHNIVKSNSADYIAALEQFFAEFDV